MKEIKLTKEQLHYIESCIDDEIESAKAALTFAESKAGKKKAERDLKFFEEFKKVLF